MAAESKFVHCPKDDNQVHIYVCCFSCGLTTKAKCSTYEKNYERLKTMLIEGKYMDKYGHPGLCEPSSYKKKKKHKLEDKTGKPSTIDEPKRTRRTKEQIEADTKKEEVKPEAVPAKPKRTRRTKAEMEADNAK